MIQNPKNVVYFVCFRPLRVLREHISVQSLKWLHLHVCPMLYVDGKHTNYHPCNLMAKVLDASLPKAARFVLERIVTSLNVETFNKKSNLMFFCNYMYEFYPAKSPFTCHNSLYGQVLLLYAIFWYFLLLCLQCFATLKDQSAHLMHASAGAV